MSRRKRIPYDPPNQRKRRRSPRILRADQIFLTRRMLIAKTVVTGSFVALGAKLGFMQVHEGATFQNLAQQNVRHPEILKAPRGLVLDRKGRPLAENQRSWQVQVVPDDLPAQSDPNRRRVLDTLIDALQLPDVLVINPNAVPKDSETTIYQRVATMLGFSQEQTSNAMQEWAYQSKINLLVNVTELSMDDAARFRAASAELPGVSVINELDYLVGNTYGGKTPIVVKNNVPREVALKLEANKIYLPGVALDDSALTRVYTGGQTMSHILGYVGLINSTELDDPRNKTPGGYNLYDQTDFIGKNGIEEFYEEQLRGQKGQRTVERDASGVEVRILPGVIEPKPGQNIKLTIDLELQQAAGQALIDLIKKAADAKKLVNDKRQAAGKKAWKIPNAGSVVAFDPRNGEIHAMISYPYYDNQLFVDGISARKWKEYNDPAQGKAFLNRAVAEVYPPGSTFKPYLATSALSRGTLKEDQTYTCKSAIWVPYTWAENKGVPYACWVAWQEGTPHEAVDIYGAIEQSCDVFFYNVGTPYQKVDNAFDPVHYYDYNIQSQQVVDNTQHVFNGLGIDKMHEDMTKQFWFGTATGVDLPWEAAGIFPSPAWKTQNSGEYWAAGDTIITSIGQGDFNATPLQMATNLGAIANEGTIYTPRLALEMIDGDGKATKTKPAKARQLRVDKKFFDIVVEGMRRVVHEAAGTAHQNGDGSSKWTLTNPDGETEIKIGGKTGTAEIGAADEDGLRDTHAWFTCFAPLDKPEIAIAVVIENGGEGATFAVPVADRVLRGYLELTGKRKRGKVLNKTPLPVPSIS